MPELIDLPDLAREVRERAVVPPYAEVSRRARSRRRRSAAGTVAAAVVLAGGLAVWQEAASPSAGPDRVPPADQTTRTPLLPGDERLWKPVVAGALAHPFAVSGSVDGSVAILWRSLVQPAPTFALVIRTPDGRVIGRRLDGPVTLTPVSNGWVALRGHQAWFVEPGSDWISLGTPGPVRAPRAGDVLVDGQGGPWLVDPDRLTWDRAPGGALAEAITSSGRLITCSGTGYGHVRLTVGGTLTQWMGGDGCLMAANGEAVSAVGLDDGPGGSTSLAGLLVSQGGQFRAGDWRHLSDVASLAVTADGSTVVTGGGESFVLSPDRTKLTQPDQHLGVVFVAGNRLYATSYGQDKGPLLYSDDDGATWQETTLPGLD